MLEKLKRLVGANSSELATPVEQQVETISMEAFNELKTKFTALEAEMAEAVSIVEKAVADKQGVEALLAAANETIANMSKDNETLVAKAVADKLEARKSELVSVLGTTKADSMLEAVKALDDNSFKAVVSGFKAASDAEKNSPLFKEVGVSDQPDEEKMEADKVSNTEKILKDLIASGKFLAIQDN